MADFVLGPDQIFAVVSVASGGNSLVISDPDDGTLTVTAPAANYMNHLQISGFPSPAPANGNALLGTLEARLNLAATTATYTIESNTPSGSDLALSGIKITRSPAADFSLVFAGGSATTLDPRLIGWAGDESSDQASGAGGVLESPYSVWGVWQSYTIEGHAAQSKDKDPFQNIELSSDDVAVAARKKYLEKTFRTMTYEYVPGAHVRENRANDLASANTGGLPQYDVHNALEAMWPLLTAADDDDRLTEFVIVHNRGDEGLDDIYSRPYEICRLKTKEQIRRFKSVREMQRMAGEYYRLSFDIDVTTGTYDQ